MTLGLKDGVTGGCQVLNPLFTSWLMTTKEDGMYVELIQRARRLLICLNEADVIAVLIEEDGAEPMWALFAVRAAQS